VPDGINIFKETKDVATLATFFSGLSV